MNKNIITPNHNEKKEITIQVAQVVELGTATTLTLGACNSGGEAHGSYYGRCNK